MKKTELIEKIAGIGDLSKAAAAKTLDTVLLAITAGLVENSEVVLPGFGSFKVSRRAARTGRNPQTGETIQIKESLVATFKAGKGLKEAIAERES